MKNLLLLVVLLTISVTATAEKKHKNYETKVYKEKHALGLKRNVKKHWQMKHRARKLQITQDLPIPAKVDLSPLVSPPENQGSCGSCWAFGITKSLRSAFMLKNKDPGVLAFNYLLNNCGGVANEYGCNGGDFNAGENMINGGKGPWLESQDPYTQRQGRCKSGLPVAATGISWNLVGNENRAPTFKELAAAIAQKHMLTVDVAVCGQWGNYSGGIYDRNQCGPRSINHIINMNGYVCEQPDPAGNCVWDASGQPVGGGYLIAMNNWGDQWGEKGYMRTRYGINAIANTAMYFEVDAPTPPTPPVPPAPPLPHDSIPVWVWIIVGSLFLGVLVLGLLTVLNLKKKASRV